MDSYILTPQAERDIAFELARTLLSEHAQDVLAHNEGAPIVVGHDLENAGTVAERAAKIVRETGGVPSLALSTLALRVPGGFQVFQYQGFIPYDAR